MCMCFIAYYLSTCLKTQPFRPSPLLSMLLQMPPRRALAPKPTTMDMIYQFNKLKPPKFLGGANPLRYEEWVRTLENLFEIMDVQKDLKWPWQLTSLRGR